MKRVGHLEKDGESGRKLILLVRQDRYVVDEQDHKLILKDFGLEVAGRHGKQGRLEVHCNEARAPGTPLSPSR